MAHRQAPVAAWPNLSEVAACVGLSLAAMSRLVRSMGAVLETVGRETRVRPDAAVRALETRGIPHGVAEAEVDSLVAKRIAGLPALASLAALADRPRPPERPARPTSPGDSSAAPGSPRRSVVFRSAASPRRLSLDAPRRRIPSRAEMDARLGARQVDLEAVIYDR